MYTFISGIMRIKDDKTKNPKFEDEIRAYLGPSLKVEIGPRHHGEPQRNDEVRLPHTDRECLTYKIGKGLEENEYVLTFYGDLFRFGNVDRAIQWFNELCKQFVPVKQGMMVINMQEGAQQVVLVWNDSIGVIQKNWDA